MIRSSQNTYYQPNTGKFQIIADLLTAIAPAVLKKANEFIALARKEIKIKPLPGKAEYHDLPFSATLNQIIANHASAQARSIVNKVIKANKVQPTKRSKTQTELLAAWQAGIQIDNIRVNLNLDQRVVEIIDGNDSSSHDYWINFRFPRMPRFSLPMRKTKHMRQLEMRGFALKRNTLRINQNGSVTLIYEKCVGAKAGDKRIGIDLGRSKAITRSDGYTGYPLEHLLAKIDRKKQGSKGYKRTKIELQHAVNYSAKRDIDYLSFDELVVERLKDIKRNKRWGNRSHHWRVGLLHNKILSRAEEFGVRVIQVNPAYTSQTCSGCGHRDKKNRRLDRFRCLRCNLELDADVNAARVIEQRGASVSLVHKQRYLVSAVT